MRKLEIPSPAKLNLFLEVINKRRDGYHNILTVFERINLFDYILIEKAPRGVEIFSDSRELPLDKSNLAYKAAMLFSRYLKKDLGVKIRIFKNIPLAAGLGGGSSNAAAVISGMNRLYGLGLDKDTLFKFGGKIGSDVNFFLSGKSFAIGLNRGEKILPLNTDKRLWHILIYPGITSYTKDVYNNFRIGLTKKKPDVRILLDALNHSRSGEVKKHLFNSLEAVVEDKYTAVSFWKRKLQRTGVGASLVSGSGSSIFGIVNNGKEAEALRKKLGYPGKAKIFIVSTY